MKYLSNINNYSEKEPERASEKINKIRRDIEDRIQNIFNDLDKELLKFKRFGFNGCIICS